MKNEFIITNSGIIERFGTPAEYQDYLNNLDEEVRGDYPPVTFLRSKFPTENVYFEWVRNGALKTGSPGIGLLTARRCKNENNHERQATI